MQGLAWLLTLMTCLLGRFVGTQQSCPRTGERPGYASKLGVILCYQDFDGGHRHLEIPSPDGAVLLVVDGDSGKFMESTKQLGQPFTVGRDEEIIWSPDSKALIFTLNLGGLGPTIASVGYVDSKVDLQLPDFTATIKADFAARHVGAECSKDVNVGGLAWEEGSKRAVFVAEVPSSSSCGKMLGHFEAYVISIPEGKILARLSQKETKKRWRKILIPELLDDK